MHGLYHEFSCIKIVGDVPEGSPALSKSLREGECTIYGKVQR